MVKISSLFKANWDENLIAGMFEVEKASGEWLVERLSL